MAIRVRPIDNERDLPRMAELMNTIVAEPMTVALLQERENRRPAGQILHRHAAIDEHNNLIGYNVAVHEPWVAEGRFWMLVLVDPQHRRQGIGTLLYDDAMQFLQTQGVTRIDGQVRDAQPEALRFVEQRDFTVNHHMFESRIMLDTFNEGSFAGTIEAVEASGIRFLTLADAGNTEENQRRLYELDVKTSLDIPGFDDPIPPFEAYRREFYQASWFRPEAQLIAVDGDRWVGMASLGYVDTTNSLFNFMTGVDGDYRGRKLALALKLLAIRYGQRIGAAFIRTNNDAQNAPMLAVNRRLGYQPQPGYYQVVKRFATSPETNEH